MFYWDVDYSKVNTDLHRDISIAVAKMKIKGQKERQLQVAIELGLHVYVTILEGVKYWIQYSKIAQQEIPNYGGQDTKCDAFKSRLDKSAQSIVLKIGKYERSLRLRQQRRGEPDFIDLHKLTFLP